MTYEEMLKEKQKKVSGRSSLEFPLERLQINQSAGKFTLGSGENAKELGKEIELVFIKRYVEYSHYDAEAESFTKRTTIEESATDCKELYNGTPVKQLKDEGYDMKFTAHYISLLKNDGDWKPVDFQTRGAVVNAIIEFFTKNKEFSKLTLGYIATLKLIQKKKGAVKYFVPEISIRKATEDDVKKYIELVEEPVEKFDEFRKAYNNRNKPVQTTVHEEVVNEEVENDEPVPF